MDRAAWAEPASDDEVMQAAGFLRSATEIGLRTEQRMSDPEFGTFLQLLSVYAYTAAELRLAMREVPRDPDRFGGAGVTVQDVERVIRRHRDLRRRLEGEITREQRNELLVALPELRAEDFAKVGEDRFQNPVFCHGPTRRALAAERAAKPNPSAKIVRLP